MHLTTVFLTSSGEAWLITWAQISYNSLLIQKRHHRFPSKPQLHHVMQKGSELAKCDILILRFGAGSFLRGLMPPITPVKDYVKWILLGIILPYWILKRGHSGMDVIEAYNYSILNPEYLTVSWICIVL